MKLECVEKTCTDEVFQFQEKNGFKGVKFAIENRVIDLNLIDLNCSLTVFGNAHAKSQDYMLIGIIMRGVLRGEKTYGAPCIYKPSM